MGSCRRPFGFDCLRIGWQERSGLLKIRRAELTTQPAGRRSAVTAFTLFLVASVLATTVSFAIPRATSAQLEPLITAQAAPETALFYAAVNLDRESAQWTAAADLVERAGLGEALDQALTDAELGPAEQTVLDAVFGGEAALVLSQFPETGDLDTGGAAETISDPSAIAQGVTPEGFSIVLAPRDPDAAFDVISQELDETASEQGTEVETAEYNGFEILNVPAADEFSTGQAIARVEDYVVFATIPEDIEPIIDTVNGDTAPLAEEENFSRLQGELNAEFLAIGYINGPSILEGAEAVDPEAFAAVGEEATAALQAYTGFVAWADEPGFRVDTLSIPAEGREIEAAEPVDTTLAEQVPADSLIYASGTNLGQTPGLEALGLLLAQTVVGEEPTGTAPEGEDPEAYSEEIFAQAEEELGFNIRTDFIDQLVGPFAFAVTVDNLFGGEPVIDGVLASGTEDPEVVSGVVDQIAILLTQALGEEGEITTRDVNDSTVQVLDLSASGLPIILELGVVDDQFILGLGEGLEDFVNGPDESLAESENYQAVMAELPEEYNAVGYVNLEATIALAEEVSGTLGGQVADADPACGEFDSQEEAQAAYDEDPFENFALNQDFDETACEDFFATGTPVAEAGSQFSNVRSIATVSFVRDDLTGTSTLLYIADE